MAHHVWNEEKLVGPLYIFPPFLSSKSKGILIHCFSAYFRMHGMASLDSATLSTTHQYYCVHVHAYSTVHYYSIAKDIFHIAILEILVCALSEFGKDFGNCTLVRWYISVSTHRYMEHM